MVGLVLRRKERKDAWNYKRGYVASRTLKNYTVDARVVCKDARG